MEPGHGILVAHDVHDLVGTVFLYPRHVVATATAPSRRRRSSHFCCCDCVRENESLGMLNANAFDLNSESKTLCPQKPFSFDLEGNCTNNRGKPENIPFLLYVFSLRTYQTFKLRFIHLALIIRLKRSRMIFWKICNFPF